MDPRTEFYLGFNHAVLEPRRNWSTYLIIRCAPSRTSFDCSCTGAVEAVVHEKMEYGQITRVAN